ncbi:MAG: DedA family protein [Chlamydiota bacterium]
MDFIVNYIISHADYAHFLIFGLLILAGFNFPISEDVLLIIGGMIASYLGVFQAVYFFIWIYLGCYLSDLMIYGMGYLLGENLFNRSKRLRRLKDKGYIAVINNFYRSYGGVTLIVGRFIPFGVRNGLFLVAGISKIPFIKFMLVDAFACALSNTLLFSLAYYFGRNYSTLISYIKVYNWLMIAFVLVILFSIVLFFRYKSKIKQTV